MAETSTPLGVVNLWIRSTDVQTLSECQMKYFLGRKYERDYQAGYFLLGTVAHTAFEQMLEGMSPEDAYMRAANTISEELENSDEPWRWTKKRTADTVYKDLRMLIDKWYEAVFGGGVEEYTGIGPVALEFTTNAKFGDIYPSQVVSTQIDSIWKQTGGVYYQIVDWKTGATAKADPRQLWIYGWAARHTEGSPVYGVPAHLVELWFHHTAFGRIQRVDYPGDEAVVALLKWAHDQKDAGLLRNGNIPMRPDWYCNYCQWQSKCPAYGQDYQTVTENLLGMTTEITPATEGT